MNRVPLPAVITGVCRWCEGPSRVHVQGGVERCDRGCLPADTPERFLLDCTCQDCGRRFHTGASSGHQCWQCERGELARVTREVAAGGKRLTRYTTDSVRRGMAQRGKP